MVKPTIQHAALTDAEQLPTWLEQVKEVCGFINTELLKKACMLSLQYGERQATPMHTSAFYQGIEVADTLSKLNLDQDTIIAGVLMSTAQYSQMKRTIIKDQLGPNIANLVQGTIAMNALDDITLQSQTVDNQEQINNLRKMMLAMVGDARVVLIKLAERISIMRHIKMQDDETRKKYARETMNIYAPLANRLGIAQIKWELEDLGFASLEPETYKSIATLLAEKRISREERMVNFKKSLERMLEKAGINAEITSRVKHIYSIHRKMQRKNLPYGEIYDILASRILVERVEDCYAALGIVHASWDYIPNEFDDYISKPKPNGYQSIHTVIRGPSGKLVEIQIRTHKMHEDSEYGFAAHWVYKEGRSDVSSYEDKIARLRGLLEWHKELTHGQTPIEKYHDEVFEDQVYVFTPAGDIIDLQKGATPLDFAYHIHSDIGHRCRGAKVNGHLVPLTYRLSTGERVTIITTRDAKPSRDWLNDELGYLATTRAKTKIQHWFKQLHHDEHVADGKQILERELAKYDIHEPKLDKIAIALNVKTTENLYAALSNGNIRLGHVLNAIDPELTKRQQPKTAIFKHTAARKNKGSFSIEGVDDLLTSIAGCCKPIPGDNIVGYITVGRGVTIHRKNCSNLSSHHENDRVVDVAWEQSHEALYQADIHVYASNRSGLINEITAVFSNNKVNVVGLNTRANTKENTADILITIETPDAEKLDGIVDKLSQISSIISVQRTQKGSKQ